jgi:hypothetical protein
VPVLTLRQQQALIDALAKRVAPDIAKAFVAAINTASNQINVAALTAAIRAGNLGAIMAILRSPQALFFPMNEAVRAAFMAGALSVADQVPFKNPFNGSRLLVAFDGHHSLAEKWARDNGATLIEGILESQILSVRAIIADGIAINRTTSEMALDLVGRINRATGKREGGILGLNASQTDTLIGARADLSSGEAWRLKHYLNLKSRDPAFDKIVEQAIRTGQPLPRDVIEQILTKQKNRMLKQRGEMIARDQAYTAIDTGQHQGWKQLADSGQVSPRDVTKRWQHNLNRPARPDHLEISGKVVSLDEAFEMPDGTRMQHTHDSAGGAKNCLNCHCTTFYRLRKGRGLGT